MLKTEYRQVHDTNYCCTSIAIDSDDYSRKYDYISSCDKPWYQLNTQYDQYNKFLNRNLLWRCVDTPYFETSYLYVQWNYYRRHHFVCVNFKIFLYVEQVATKAIVGAIPNQFGTIIERQIHQQTMC